MINRLKMMELVRYAINSNMNYLHDKYVRENSKAIDDTVSAVFSTGFSLIATNLGSEMCAWFAEAILGIDKSVESTSRFQSSMYVLMESIFIFSLFVLAFSISFVIFRKIWRKIQKIKYANRSASFERTLKGYKKIMDDFDNFACDAILFSQYFIESFESNQSNGRFIDETDRFNIYEAIYYIEKAEILTQEVFVHGDNCINNNYSTDRISIHRIENMILMIEGSIKTIQEYVELIKGGMNCVSGKSLTESLVRIQNKRDELRKNLNNYMP